MKNNLRKFSTDLGFDLFGVIRPGRVPGFDKFEQWLKAGNQADMHWLENNPDKRADTSLVLENCRSIIVLGSSYFNRNYTTDEINNPDRALIARYAWGEDYHEVLRSKLLQMTEFIESFDALPVQIKSLKLKTQKSKPQLKAQSQRPKCPDVLSGQYKHKIYTDTGPVLEKWLGAEAGLGFIGRNSCLINHNIGSYFMISTIFTQAPLPEMKEKIIGSCGDCRRCLEACPTGAINDDRTIDARKCMAYHTIENKGEILPEIQRKMKNRIFGCDVCQEVCPWNKFARITKIEELKTKNGRDELTVSQMKEMDREVYQRLFKKSAVKRAGLERLKRNLPA